MGGIMYKGGLTPRSTEVRPRSAPRRRRRRRRRRCPPAAARSRGGGGHGFYMKKPEFFFFSKQSLIQFIKTAKRVICKNYQINGVRHNPAQ